MTSAALSPTARPTTPDSTPAAIPTGCAAGPLHQAPPYQGTDFSGTSGWAQVIDGECVSVWVGQAGADDTADGAVLFYQQHPGQSTAGAQPLDNAHVVTVPDSGRLTVKSTDGTRMIATGADGRVYAVDMRTGVVTPNHG
jgi:hypothetical protein